MSRFVLLLLCASVSADYGTTLQEQVDAAPPGAVLQVPAGRYEGSVLITKPIVLRAQGEVQLHGSGKTHVVHIKAENVTVEGFHISGSGLELGKDHAGVFIEGNSATVRGNSITDSLHGIYVKKAQDCRLIQNRIEGKEQETVAVSMIDPRARPDSGETCEVGLDQNRRGNGIHLWNSERITIIGNQIESTRDGIYFSFANHCTVRSNSIRRVRFGLHYMYSDGNVFENNVFTENSAGSTLMFSKNLVIRGNTFAANVGHRAYGMVLTSVDTSRIERNNFVGNSIGLCLEYSNNNTFAGNFLVRSYIGARLTASSDGNRFTRNVFSRNMHPVELDGDFSRNSWSDGKVGNRWGNSAEVDLNGDGVGDLPHREADLLGGLRRPFPAAALLSGSPALDLIRFAQQHAKVPGIPAIQDPAPLATIIPNQK
ncbi:NosD domain-containing protein [Verrucomicrobiota bacterium sgz303538]